MIQPATPLFSSNRIEKTPSIFLTDQGVFLTELFLVQLVREHTQQSRHLRIGEHRRQRLGRQALRQIKLLLRLLRGLVIVECLLKELSIVLAVVVEDVRIYICDHSDLRMTRISLYGFYVSSVELELVGYARVAEAVEHYRGEIVLNAPVIVELSVFGVLSTKTVAMLSWSPYITIIEKAQRFRFHPYAEKIHTLRRLFRLCNHRKIP